MLIVDSQIHLWNMAVLARIAERHPGLKLHIDHLGRGGGAPSYC